MAGVTLVNGTVPLSVKLNLDMRAYCEACKLLLESRATLAKADAAIYVATPENMVALQSELTAAKESYRQVISAFYTERDEFTSELSGIWGAEYWAKIKKMLSLQCNPDHPKENELSLLLVRSESRHATAPLAVESLDNSFIELLKNSIDALLKQYLIHATADTMLEMDIVFTLKEENMAITITDNGGGFSDSYLERFASYIQTKAYKLKTWSDEKQCARGCYLGGAGRGIPTLCNLILDGEILENRGVSGRRYQVPAGATAISIRNNPLKKGAEITLVSPLAPFVPHPGELKQVDGEKLSSGALHDGGGRFFLAQPPIAKKKKSILSTIPPSSSAAPSGVADPMDVGLLMISS